MGHMKTTLHHDIALLNQLCMLKSSWAESSRDNSAWCQHEILPAAQTLSPNAGMLRTQGVNA